MPLNPFQILIKEISDELDADIFTYVGAIDRPQDDRFITRVKNFKRRPNVLLLLTTLGGDPNAAYRIARCLQSEYETVQQKVDEEANTTPAKGKFYIFVDS